MPSKIYDVIVVGTGAGGGMAIKTLCEAGLSVLALNPGRRTVPSRDYRNHKQPYDMKYRGFGDPRADRYHEESEYAHDCWEHDIAYTNAPGTDWEWVRVKVTGGKCNFWGRSSARFGDIDFQAASLDGVDVDWPVTYKEIAPYYSRIEKWIGVASTVQNRPSNPDGEYIPPFPFRCLDCILQKAADKIGVPYLPDRIAQLTVAHNGHAPCHYCGGCSTGCDTGSFFSPTWFTIPAGEATGKLELRTNAIAKNVLVDENGHAKGVAYIDRETREEVVVFAKAVVMAASCVETAHIMLNSKSRIWPTGIANSSGQLGRNLCDHLYGTPAMVTCLNSWDNPAGRTTFPTRPFPGCRAGKTLRTRARRSSFAATRSTPMEGVAASPGTSRSLRVLGVSLRRISSGTIPLRSALRSRLRHCRARQTTWISILR